MTPYRNTTHIVNQTETEHMDIPRYALIAASILLGLMLLGEWTRFTADEQALIPASPIVESTAQKDSPTLLGDATTSFDQSPQDDLPSDEDLAQSSSADIYNGISAQANSLVRVTTDVLEIIIDLEGGDVVGAALRDYPKTLADPSDPFVLLERNGQRTYVAQSGLVGPDGIDRQARALYRTDRPSYELASGNTLDIDLHYQNDDGALAVKKIYRFQRGSHTILVDHEIQNLSSRTTNLTPFAQLKRDSSSAPSDNNSGMGMRPFLGSALTHSEQRFDFLGLK